MDSLSASDGRSFRPRRDVHSAGVDGIARGISAGLTLGIMLLVAHWLVETSQTRVYLPRAALSVTWIAPPPQARPAPPAPPTPLPTPTPTAPRPAASISATTISAAPSIDDDPPPEPAGDDARRLDYGALMGAGEPIRFAERLPGQRDRYRTAFDSSPKRFRMRRSVTPEDVVRGFAQLVGLWPPGYTDSPCPAIRGLIETTPETPSARELALLQDAVLAREQFCT